MKVYLYDETTKEFLTEYTCQPDPMEKGKFITPNVYTKVAPPVAGKNEVPVFGAKGWVLEPDFRGKVVFDTTTGDEVLHSNIGALPAGLTDQKPFPNSKWDASVNAWVFDAVLAAENQKAIINGDCDKAIAVGFDSSALGAPHHYDCDTHDQLNVMGLVASGIDHPYRCTDAAGVKAKRPHTAAQLKQVFDDGLLHISANTSTADVLKSTLDTLAKNTATTQADIDKVVWK